MRKENITTEQLRLKNQILQLKYENQVLLNNLQSKETDELRNKEKYIDNLFTQEGINILMELENKYRTLYQTLNAYMETVISIDKEMRFIRDLLTNRITITKQHEKTNL